MDLTQELYDAANEISEGVNLSDKTVFLQGDSTDLSFPDSHFDGAVPVHVAMNVPEKATVYAEARRFLKSGARFRIYDILQGEGGEFCIRHLRLQNLRSVISRHPRKCPRIYWPLVSKF
nr:methyltransferase domain-containing protein [uncultured Ruegeria sp.]